MSFVNADHLTTTESDEAAGHRALRTKLARWGKGAAGVLARSPVKLLPRRAATEASAPAATIRQFNDRPRTIGRGVSRQRHRF